MLSFEIIYGILLTHNFYTRRSLFTNPGDKVVDLFCGSGAATIAAIASKRNCVAVDNEPEMVCCYSHSLRFDFFALT